MLLSIAYFLCGTILELKKIRFSLYITHTFYWRGALVMEQLCISHQVTCVLIIDVIITYLELKICHEKCILYAEKNALNFDF